MRRFTQFFLAPLTVLFLPLATLADVLLTATLRFFDILFPMAELALASGPPLRVTREVTYLRQGVHRLAQPVLMRAGDQDDDDDDDDNAIDSGSTSGVASA